MMATRTHLGALPRARRLAPVLAAAALALAACDGVPAPAPAEALWPNAPLPEVEPWRAEAAFVDNFDDFADQIRVHRGVAEGVAATEIENLSTSRAIEVYYVDISGNYQAVQIDPGASLPVGGTPREILGVE
ncbi:MAG: hypothetical protein H6843_17590 [Rhodospirillaceae bacterium]|nr:hypothetical protein [Rhodospirillaceae bacterium]